MSDEGKEAYIDIIKEIIDSHPPISTDELKKQLVGLAEYHLKNATEVNGEERVPMARVSTCILISVLREIVHYRDQYGFIELPDEKWDFSKEE
jgi:hypothetical protein